MTFRRPSALSMQSETRGSFWIYFAHTERSRRINAEGVSYLSRELDALGIPVWPTDANFVLAKVGAGQDERLLREGVIVRPLTGFGMPEHVRISVGLPEENERLVKTLRLLLESGS